MHEVWRTESDHTKQTAASVLMALVGLVFAYGFRHFEGPGVSGSRAGFLLGLLLLVVGIGGLVAGGKQAIVVDPASRCLCVEQTGFVATKRRFIPFREVDDVRVEEFGDSDGGSVSYHVVLTLKSGLEVPLFFGFYDGAYDRAVAAARRERILAYLKA